MRAFIIAGLIAAATPAFATDKPPVTPPAPQQTNNFFQKLTNRVENNLAQKQAQQQMQGQAQGQGQNQTATGGNANNSNNVNIDNRTRITNAPPVYGTGDTYGVSGAVAGVAFGAVVPSRAYGRRQIGKNIIELSGDRTVLYTQCGLPDTHRTLMLKGIRCDLNGAELIAWEAQFQPKKQVSRKAVRPARKKNCGCR